MSTSNRTLKQRAWHETKEFLVIAVYLWVVLALLILHKSVILAENNIIDLQSQGFAIINALALGKVILIAKGLGFAEPGKDTPLIYPTLIKSASYSLLLAIFKTLEEAAVGMYHGRSFSQSIADFGGGTWKGILSLTAIMFVFLIPFFAFGAVQEVVGEGKLVRLFLHERHALSRPEPQPDTAHPVAAQAKPGERASA